MRATIIILLCGLITTGCASSKSENVTTTAPSTQRVPVRQPSASALVFDLPTRNPYQVDLERYDPAVAYMGYETVNIHSSWVRTDDRFRGGDKDQSRFDRRAVSSQIIERVR